jgi:antitoxin (DNA-binding transcriptional repressor) of toxin-antitoxin stability system
MAQPVSMTTFARQLAEYVNRVTYRGESFQIRRAGKPVAEIRPPRTGRPLAELGSVLDSLPRLGTAEAADFARDLEAQRVMPGATRIRNPWLS